MNVIERQSRKPAETQSSLRCTEHQTCGLCRMYRVPLQSDCREEVSLVSDHVISQSIPCIAFRRGATVTSLNQNVEISIETLALSSLDAVPLRGSQHPNSGIEAPGLESRQPAPQTRPPALQLPRRPSRPSASGRARRQRSRSNLPRSGPKGGGLEPGRASRDLTRPLGDLRCTSARAACCDQTRPGWRERQSSICNTSSRINSKHHDDKVVRQCGPITATQRYLTTSLSKTCLSASFVVLARLMSDSI